MQWFDTKIKPPVSRTLLVHCPHWNVLGYEVATWCGHRFESENTDNQELFNEYVEKWALVLEVE